MWSFLYTCILLIFCFVTSRILPILVTRLHLWPLLSSTWVSLGLCLLMLWTNLCLHFHDCPSPCSRTTLSFDLHPNYNLAYLDTSLATLATLLLLSSPSGKFVVVYFWFLLICEYFFMYFNLSWLAMKTHQHFWQTWSPLPISLFIFVASIIMRTW